MFLIIIKVGLLLMFPVEDGKMAQENISDLIPFGLMTDMLILLKNKSMLLKKELKREDKPILLNTEPLFQSTTELTKFHQEKHNFIPFDHNTYMNNI